MSHEQGEKLANNQQLNFGDAVRWIISAELYKHFSDCDEGALSKAQARLVEQEALAERHGYSTRARARAQSWRGDQQWPGTALGLADALRRWSVRSIWMAGYQSAAIHPHRVHRVPLAADVDGTGNLRASCGRFCRANAVAPEYRLLEMEGPDHDRSFVCAVRHSNELARSRQARRPRMTAAQAAIDSLRAKGKACRGLAGRISPLKLTRTPRFRRFTEIF